MSEITVEPSPREDGVGRITFDCPNRPGCRCYVPIRREVHKGKTWKWNGDLAAPTITPSIDCTLCGWHGFITNGEIKP